MRGKYAKRAAVNRSITELEQRALVAERAHGQLTQELEKVKADSERLIIELRTERTALQYRYDRLYRGTMQLVMQFSGCTAQEAQSDIDNCLAKSGCTAITTRSMKPLRSVAQ